MNPVFNDSTTNDKPHKILKEEFWKRYGTDDTSRALIHFYFEKRTTNKSLAIGSGAATAIAAGSAGAVLLATTTFNLVSFLLIITLMAMAYVTALMLVVGVVFFVVNNRRRLHRMLRHYHSRNGLPRRLRRKKSFLRLLKKASTS